MEGVILGDAAKKFTEKIKIEKNSGGGQFLFSP